eukprot:SAG25_NODE_229_length_11447_cov_5.927476_8_plen_405_part_00
MGFNDRWLAAWLEHNDAAADAGQPVRTDERRRNEYIVVYVIGTAVFLVGLLASSALVQLGAARAARTLHDDCVASLLQAPVSYFEGTPSGRLISRFSSDVTTADNALMQFGDNWLQFAATIIVYYVVVIMILPSMVIAALVVTITYWLQVIAVDRSNREVKRMANAAMAPILTDISESADARLLLRHCAFSVDPANPEPRTQAASASGPTTADAAGAPAAWVQTAVLEDSVSHAQRYMEARFDRDVDEYLLLNFCSCSLINWSQQVSYLVSLVFSLAVAASIVLQARELSPAEAALALSYSFSLPYFLMFFGFITSNVKVALTALERLLELLDVPHEPAWHVQAVDSQLPANWPRAVSGTGAASAGGSKRGGTIEFRGASLRYGLTLPLAVNQLTMTIGKISGT